MEGTGPIGVTTLFSNGGAASEFALTMVNLGAETIDVTNQAGTPLFSLPPGQSRGTSLSSFTSSHRWSCAGSGDYRFAWVVRRF